MDYFPDYKPRDYNPSTYKGPPGTFKFCIGCKQVKPRKDWSKRQWKKIDPKHAGTAGTKTPLVGESRCLECVDNYVDEELTNPQRFMAKTKGFQRNAALHKDYEVMDREALQEKDKITSDSVLLTDPDAGSTIIKKEDGFTHNDLAEILIRSGPKAEIETEKFVRKQYNTYFCKITQLEVQAVMWDKHVIGRRKIALRRKIQAKEHERQSEKKRRLIPAGAPELEFIPASELNNMTEENFDRLLYNRDLLYQDYCLMCHKRVLAAWEMTHCNGKNHQALFKRRPVRVKKGK